MKPRLHIRGARFLGGGVGGFAIEYLLTLLFVEAMNFNPVLAYAIALLIGALLAYLYHNLYTFGHGRLSDQQAIRRFVLIYGNGLLLNWFLSSVLTLTLLPYYIAIPLVSGVLGVINFFLYDKLVFAGKAR